MNSSRSCNESSVLAARHAATAAKMLLAAGSDSVGAHSDYLGELGPRSGATHLALQLKALGLVLPGLDRTRDGTAGQEVARDQGHPQFGLSRLLDRFGIDRAAVLGALDHFEFAMMRGVATAIEQAAAGAVGFGGWRRRRPKGPTEHDDGRLIEITTAHF